MRSDRGHGRPGWQRHALLTIWGLAFAARLEGQATLGADFQRARGVVYPRVDVNALELRDLVAAGYLTRIDSSGAPWLGAVIVFKRRPPLFMNEDSLAAQRERWNAVRAELARAMPNMASVDGATAWAMIGYWEDTVGVGPIRAVMRPERHTTRVLLIDQPDERPARWRVDTLEVTTPIGRLFWPRTEVRGDRILRIEARDRARYMLAWLRQTPQISRWLDDSR